MGLGAGVAKRWQRARHALAHRTSHVLVGLGLAAGSVLLVVAAWLTAPPDSGFASDLYLNVGAGLAIALATYLALNPLFKELRTASIVEHPWLDRDALIGHFARSRHSVAILETWTTMLEEPYLPSFILSIRGAIAGGAYVQILLLDPDSTGTRLRSQELRHKRDVQLAVMSNLGQLSSLHAELDSAQRARLNVRFYAASPSIQMYRWDDRAFISFFPLDRSNFSAPQIETYMSTPLGEFVQSRFEELWYDSATRELDEICLLRVRARLGERLLDPCDVWFVELDGVRYVTGFALDRQIRRHGIEHLTLLVEDRERAAWAQTPYLMDEAYELDAVLYRRVVDLFAAKYNTENVRHEEHPLILVLLPATGEHLRALPADSA